MNEDSFKEHIKKLEKYEKKLSSLWWNFLRGIVYGFGFFIGSAIFAAIVIYILSRYFDGGWFQEVIDIIKK